ncbi:cytochrome P450 [Russula compacta]|nr:cytochrome P450 [Russula compacta]
MLPILRMMDWQWFLPSASSNDRPWRLGRRILDRGLRPSATASYHQMQQWEAHVELFQGELVLAMTYGYEVLHRDDKMVEASKRMSEFGVPKILPGALLVNDIPFLRHIPEWLPWFSYKPLARVGTELGKQVLYPPIQFVKESILNGTARPSLALEHFQEMENLKLSGSDRDEAEDTLAGALASIYAVGTDTTVSAMRTFLVAMLLYPDVQKKAQHELDFIIGRERLPTFEDRPRLPFIDAVCKEVLRWRPVTPLAVPHATTKDDIYAGFFIPKETVVLVNTWAILHDPAIYPEPDIFRPERFLNPDGSLRDDPILTSAFGFGKRICPGRHIVNATLFISVASLLSVFNIERGIEGRDKLSDYPYIGRLLSYPCPFPCSFVPRDKPAEEIIIANTLIG